MNEEDFLRELHKQTQPNPVVTKANEDKRILRTIRSFVTKQTKEYQEKINKKKWSTIWYYGVKAGLAGVDYDTAIEFVKAAQSPCDMTDFETEFYTAYSSVVFDQKKRDWYFHK